MVKKKIQIKLPPLEQDERYKNACLSQVNDLTKDQEQALRKWLNNPKHFLIIYSDFGIGKTYLVEAIRNSMYEKNLHVYFVTEKKMFAKISEREQEGTYSPSHLLDLYGNHFFIWDDFGSTITNGKNDFKDNERKNIMFQFIDERYSSKLPTIITTNYTVEELGNLINPRIGSRLAATENLFIELIGEDKRKLGY